MTWRAKFYQQNEYRLYHKILLKYKIMAVRSKIAFMAMMKKQTVVELITTQCLKTFDLVQDCGLVKRDYKQIEIESVLSAAMTKQNISLLKALVAVSNYNMIEGMDK